MRAIAWLIALCLATGRVCNAADDFTVDTYDFDWKVSKSGDMRLVFRKDEDSTRVIIGGQLQTMSMTPDEAAEVGAAFAQTSEMSAKLKGSKGKTERVKAGKHVVTFQTTDEGSFFLSLRRDEQFSIGSVILNREDALVFVPHLRKAKEMAAFLEKAVEPNAKAKPVDPVEAKKAAEAAKLNAERSQAEAVKARADADRVKAEAEKATAATTLIIAKRDAAVALEELEASASRKLAFAKQFLSKDKTVAKKRLTEIVDKFADTPAATEAAELIKKLK